MERSTICKSLFRESYQLGAPIGIVLACYLIPLVLFLIWRQLWFTLIFGVCAHVFFSMMFRKDKFIIKDFFRSLTEKDILDA